MESNINVYTFIFYKPFSANKQHKYTQTEYTEQIHLYTVQWEGHLYTVQLEGHLYTVQWEGHLYTVQWEGHFYTVQWEGLLIYTRLVVSSNPIVVSLSKKLYDHCLVLVVIMSVIYKKQKNDRFTIE